MTLNPFLRRAGEDCEFGAGDDVVGGEEGAHLFLASETVAEDLLRIALVLRGAVKSSRRKLGTDLRNGIGELDLDLAAEASACRHIKGREMW